MRLSLTPVCDHLETHDAVHCWRERFSLFTLRLGVQEARNHNHEIPVIHVQTFAYDFMHVARQDCVTLSNQPHWCISAKPHNGILHACVRVHTAGS